MFAPRDHASLTQRRQEVDFYWRYEPSQNEEDHIKAAVEALIKTADGNDRRVSSNPHLLAHAKGSFRSRLKRLTRGELEPIEEVRALKRPRSSLFEVRWQNVRCRTKTDDDTYTHTDILLRMIFAEPPELGNAALGLHAHEKIVVEGDEQDTRHLQDIEIDHAERLYKEGEEHYWGVGIRGSSHLRV